MTEHDSQVRQLAAQTAQCLRSVATISGELQSAKARLLPVIDDVERVIGGSAQGTDTQMTGSLATAARSLEQALDSCAHARSMLNRLRIAL